MKHRIQIAVITIGATLLAAACSGAPAGSESDDSGSALADSSTRRAAATVPARPTVPPSAPALAPATAHGSGTTLGSTSYPVPASAIVVSPAGDDAANGSVAAPLRTLGKAIAIARTGATIVVRAGTYHESVTIPSGRTVTIQNWPGEVVWFDGSDAVTGWVADGSTWRRDGWNVSFDHSPTYTRGASDNSADQWRFVNPQFPMAAHPDQVWVDGAPQAQVASAVEVGPGRFHKDDAGSRLRIGTDPSGHEVRASTLIRAMSIRATGSTVRGIGFRRYSPSVPDMGAITVEAPGVTLEHLVVSDMATTGVSVVSTGATLRNVEVARSGMLGIHANYADGLRLLGVVSRANNTEHFNSAPVSGGFKVTRTRGLTVTGSVFRDNLGPGLWTDQAVYDITVTGCDMIANSGHGTSLELSAKAVFADNLVSGNGGNGIKINDTSEVVLVNNTFVGNNRPVNIVQDSRRGNDPSVPGHDPRRPFPDPTMPWVNGPVLVQGNLIAAPSAGNCLLCVEDYSRTFSAEQMAITSPGNAYHRGAANSPTWLVVWSRGATNPAVLNDLGAFRTATGQEASGQMVTGAPIVDAAGRPTPSGQALDPSAPELPASVAALIGRPAGTRHFGAFR